MRRISGVLLLTGAVLLAGCGEDSDDRTVASPTTTSSAPVNAFPVVVAAEQGDVTIDARPERIVSLSPSLTEMLFAIGAGEQVIAVDQHSNYPTSAPVTDLSGFRPNVEAIGGFEPDLVVVASDRDGVVGALANLGIPTLLLSSPEHLAGVYGQIAALGVATGHPVEASAVADTLRSEIEQLASSAPDRDEPVRYYYELSDTYHSVTSDTFIGEVLGLAGLVSIADGVDPAAGGFPQLSAEYVLDADPDVIFLAYAGAETPTPQQVAGRPGWDQLGAVGHNAVVVLDVDLSSRWGPRLPELLRAVLGATAGLPSQ